MIVSIAFTAFLVSLAGFAFHGLVALLLGVGVLHFTQAGSAVADILDHLVRNPLMEREIATIVKFVSARIPGGIGSEEGYTYAFNAVIARFPFLPHEDVDHLIHALDHDLPVMLQGFTRELDLDAAKREQGHQDHNEFDLVSFLHGFDHAISTLRNDPPVPNLAVTPAPTSVSISAEAAATGPVTVSSETPLTVEGPAVEPVTAPEPVAVVEPAPAPAV